jgi:hypothetical protein
LFSSLNGAALDVSGNRRNDNAGANRNFFLHLVSPFAYLKPMCISPRSTRFVTAGMIQMDVLEKEGTDESARV